MTEALPVILSDELPTTLMDMGVVDSHYLFHEDNLVVATLEKQLADMPRMGPGMWDTLQCAAREVRTVDDFDHFVWLRDLRLKWMRCAECKGEFTVFCDRNPIAGYRYMKDETGRVIGASSWMHRLHNWVSNRLNENDIARGRAPTHYVLQWHQYLKLYDEPKLCDGPCGSMH